MKRALILTEDERYLSDLHSALVREGYKVAVSSLAEDDLSEAVEALTPEVVVVDCRNNHKCAVELRRQLETEYKMNELLVVALLTAAQLDEADLLGIDDFLLEPYSGNELITRLRLLFHRFKGIEKDDTLSIGPLFIDMRNYTVYIDGVPIELTFKEYELLRFPATHRGRVFTRESLLNHVWGYDYYGGTRTVDVHIRRLRAKLYPRCDNMIETVRNVGYRFAIKSKQVTDL